MKKVLIVSNPLSPVPKEEPYRTAGFAGALRVYGWEPVILTREVPGLDSQDNFPGQEVPEGIDVYRTNPWELDELPGLLGRAGNWLSIRFLAPDKERLWELFSRRKAGRIMKYAGIDLIYTASPPKSTHLLGFYLKKRFPQIPWIADISSGITVPDSSQDAHRSSMQVASVKKADLRTFRLADYIITDSEGIRRAVLENPAAEGLVGLPERCFVIPDGSFQELSGIFEKACRLVASRRLAGSNT